MQTIKPVGNLLSLAVKLFSSNVGYTGELKFWLMLNANQGSVCYSKESWTVPYPVRYVQPKACKADARFRPRFGHSCLAEIDKVCVLRLVRRWKLGFGYSAGFFNYNHDWKWVYYLPCLQQTTSTNQNQRIYRISWSSRLLCWNERGSFAFFLGT